MAIIIVLIIGFIVLITYFVGDYFVRYSLVPNSGAEERVVVSDEEVAAKEKTTTAETIVNKNYAKDKELKDEWLIEMDVAAREVQITSHDGLNLSGHQFEQPSPTNQWVILVHGYQSDEHETFSIGRHFYKNGYNVLTIALRAHGGSDGKYIGMGYLDKEDLIAWTEYLVSKQPESEIIYHGTSMGGATVLMASGMTLPKNVKAVVSDCAYTGVWEIFASEMKQRFALPTFPVLYMAQIMGRIRAGYNIKDGNVLKFVKNSHLPTLFIHTKPDDFVPVSMVHELYAAKTNGEKELYLLEDGGHAEAKFVAPETYYKKVFDFIEEYT
jgi:hypothetical protein